MTQVNIICTGDGFYRQCSEVGGVGQWDALNDPVAIPDDATTCVYIYQNGAPAETERATLTFPSPNIPVDATINWVAIYHRIYDHQNGKTSRYTPMWRIGGADFYGTEIGVAVARTWESYFQQFPQNPDTLTAWTPATVNGGLEAGERLYANAGGEDQTAYCTQVFLRVDYTEAALSGLFVPNMGAKMIAGKLI